MHIIVRTARTNERNELEITIDEKTKFYVYDEDYSEQNNLANNFEDCYSIPELLAKAYRAGKEGQEIKIDYLEEDDY